MAEFDKVDFDPGLDKPPQRARMVNVNIRILPDRHQEIRELAEYFNCKPTDIMRWAVSRGCQTLSNLKAERERPNRTLYSDQLEEEAVAAVEAMPEDERESHLEEMLNTLAKSPRGSRESFTSNSYIDAHYHVWASDREGFFHRWDAALASAKVQPLDRNRFFLEESKPEDS